MEVEIGRGIGEIEARAEAKHEPEIGTGIKEKVQEIQVGIRRRNEEKIHEIVAGMRTRIEARTVQLWGNEIVVQIQEIQVGIDAGIEGEATGD